MFDFFKSRRRAGLRQTPLAPAARAIVKSNVPYAAALDEADGKELEGLMRDFLAEKSFEGCAGLEITDEIRVTIAALACVLLLHRETDLYPGVDAILVYPHAYRAPTRSGEGGVVIEGEQARLGESWTRGVVVLAWDPREVGRRAARRRAERGAPRVRAPARRRGRRDGRRARSRRPREVHVVGARAGRRVRRALEELDAGRGSDIDAYGATNPAEFFAVVTEMFFEKPRPLKRRHPELYEELAAFYRQDPAAR